MDTHAADGFATDVFTGIPVADFATSASWYTQLLGIQPSFHPTDTEAVWQLGPHAWLYVVLDPEHAGGALVTLMGRDLSRVVRDIRERGIEFDREEIPEENSRKVVYLDPDGNEIGFASVTG